MTHLRPASAKARATTTALAALYCLLAASLLFYRLGDLPPPWWDEGWNMTVARNWVETGRYVRLLDGQPVPAALQGALTVTAPVALSFRLLGFGYWQARLPFALMTLATLALLGVLGRRLFNGRVAMATLFVATLTTGFSTALPALNPGIAGRQVMGEIPALLALLAGFILLLEALRRAAWLLIPTGLLLGLALVSKLQMAPFVTLSLVTAIMAALLRRSFRSALVLAGVLLTALLATQFGRLTQVTLTSAAPGLSPGLPGLLETVALVTRPVNHLVAASIVVTWALPSLCGLVAEWVAVTRRRGKPQSDEPAQLVNLAVLAFCTGWLTWYVLLSIGWPRYAFPPVFIGSIYDAALLDRLTNAFNPVYTVSAAAAVLRSPRRAARPLLAVLLLAVSVPPTVLGAARMPFIEQGSDARNVVAYHNTQTSPDARIETYETELFLLLKRPYTYPPDEVHVDLIRRTSLGESAPVNYEPLASDPDYLVVGRQARQWRLYDRATRSDDFRLVRQFGLYDIFQRRQRGVTAIP